MIAIKRINDKDLALIDKDHDESIKDDKGTKLINDNWWGTNDWLVQNDKILIIDWDHWQIDQRLTKGWFDNNWFDKEIDKDQWQIDQNW